MPSHDQQQEQQKEQQKEQQDALYNNPEDNGILSWTNQVAWNAFSWTAAIAIGTYAVKKLLNK